MKINFYEFKEGELGFDFADALPFEVKRVYYVWNVPEDVRRGFHSHKQLKQCLICVAGSVKILLDNGVDRDIVILDNAKQGLHVGENVWHEMYDFSTDAVLLVLAGGYYDESDYIRDYNEFKSHAQGGAK